MRNFTLQFHSYLRRFISWLIVISNVFFSKLFSKAFNLPQFFRKTSSHQVTPLTVLYKDANRLRNRLAHVQSGKKQMFIMMTLLFNLVGVGRVVGQTVAIKVGLQNGVLTYGTPGSVTYDLDVDIKKADKDADHIVVNWNVDGLPAGASVSPLSSTIKTNNGGNANNTPIQITITTGANTPASSYDFTVTPSVIGLIPTSGSGKLTINKKALTVSDATADKVYDGTTAATITGSLIGIIGPDKVILNGTGTFASKNVGGGIAVTSNCTLGGVDASNYSLTQPTGVTANITPGTLTLTANPFNRTYGIPNPFLMDRLLDL